MMSPAMPCNNTNNGHHTPLVPQQPCPSSGGFQQASCSSMPQDAHPNAQAGPMPIDFSNALPLHTPAVQMNNLGVQALRQRDLGAAFHLFHLAFSHIKHATLMQSLPRTNVQQIQQYQHQYQQQYQQQQHCHLEHQQYQQQQQAATDMHNMAASPLNSSTHQIPGSFHRPFCMAESNASMAAATPSPHTQYQSDSLHHLGRPPLGGSFGAAMGTDSPSRALATNSAIRELLIANTMQSEYSHSDSFARHPTAPSTFTNPTQGQGQGAGSRSHAGSLDGNDNGHLSSVYCIHNKGFFMPNNLHLGHDSDDDVKIRSAIILFNLALALQMQTQLQTCDASSPDQHGAGPDSLLSTWEKIARLYRHAESLLRGCVSSVRQVPSRDAMHDATSMDVGIHIVEQRGHPLVDVVYMAALNNLAMLDQRWTHLHQQRSSSSAAMQTEASMRRSGGTASVAVQESTTSDLPTDGKAFAPQTTTTTPSSAGGNATNVNMVWSCFSVQLINFIRILESQHSRTEASANDNLHIVKEEMRWFLLNVAVAPFVPFISAGAA